jgi:hypothetical protein
MIRAKGDTLTFIAATPSAQVRQAAVTGLSAAQAALRISAYGLMRKHNT